MERIETSYHGLPALALHGKHLSVTVLTGEGPRLVGLARRGQAHNLLAELPNLDVDTPHGPYHLRGGHRLWAAPEDFPLTYLPDDAPPNVEALPDGVRLTGRAHPLAGLTRVIEARLDPARPAVHLHHLVVNDGAATLTLAPWSITQLPPGGTAHLPQHAAVLDAAGLLPNRNLVLWPGNDLDDPRLSLGGRRWQVRAAGGPRFKIGYLNLEGWIAYERAGTVFVKRFTPRPAALLPDMGANVEIYTDDNMIELETLGPLVTLAPGEATAHDETWEVYPVDGFPAMMG